MKNELTLILLLLFTLNIHSQEYSGIVSDSDINELLVYQIDNQPKHNDDRKLWKKRIYDNPVSWSQVIIKLISSPPYDFEFQKTELINRDKRYNRELEKITELFSESDFEFMKEQFNSEQKKKWTFNAEKGNIDDNPKKNYYSFSIPLFNEKYDKSIIYSEFGGCGNLCGEGEILVYVKTNNKWKLYKSIPLWIR